VAWTSRVLRETVSLCQKRTRFDGKEHIARLASACVQPSLAVPLKRIATGVPAFLFFHVIVFTGVFTTLAIFATM
jgi:hypothetical protein